jgi:hypothetical protein
LKRRQTASKSQYYDGPPALPVVTNYTTTDPTEQETMIPGSKNKNSLNTPRAYNFKYVMSTMPFLSLGMDVKSREATYAGIESVQEQTVCGSGASTNDHLDYQFQKHIVEPSSETGYIYVDGTPFCEWRFHEEHNLTSLPKFKYIVNHRYILPPPLLRLQD